MKAQTVILPASILLLASCHNQSGEPDTIQKPNVLFILADDLGYHDLSCMGSKYYETPNIDRIANEGIVFTEGYANSQVCSPSRASIMSGKFTARHGITDWIGAPTGEDWRNAGRFTKLLPPEYVTHLPHEYITLPEAMKEVGYKTFFSGKWHIGGKGSWPEDHGFDINKGGWDVGYPVGGFYAPWENPNLESGPDGESLTLRLARETATFIEENKDTAFFAFLSFYAVHAPLQTTQEKWAKYRQKAEDMGIAETGFKMGKFLPIRQVQDNPLYGGLVETMDDAVGIVLDALDELGLAENTIVIFTSDNGGVSAGDAFATSNLPLRGGKGYQFEGGIREPYFIKVPWLEIAGKTSEVPVTGTDFYPTLLELAGADLKPEEHNDGVSLVPLLSGGTIDERELIWHYPHYGNQGGEPSSIIRKGEWKLIHYYEDRREELYNLKTDPEETTDLAGENPEMADNLSKQLFAFLIETGARFPEKDPEYSEELEQKHLERIENEVLPWLEKQRLNLLSKDYDPGNNWWGSEDNSPLLGCYGDDFATTPYLDKMASDGFLYTHAYANAPVCASLLKSSESAIRYWGATGLLILGESAAPAKENLLDALADESANVVTVAAEALYNMGEREAAEEALIRVLKDPNEFARCHALNAIDCIEAETPELKTGVVNMLKELPELGRNDYDVRSAKRLIDKWEVKLEDYDLEFIW